MPFLRVLNRRVGLCCTKIRSSKMDREVRELRREVDALKAHVNKLQTLITGGAPQRGVDAPKNPPASSPSPFPASIQTVIVNDFSLYVGVALHERISPVLVVVRPVEELVDAKIVIVAFQVGGRIRESLTDKQGKRILPAIRKAVPSGRVVLLAVHIGMNDPALPSKYPSEFPDPSGSENEQFEVINFWSPPKMGGQLDFASEKNSESAARLTAALRGRRLELK